MSAAEKPTGQPPLVVSAIRFFPHGQQDHAAGIRAYVEFVLDDRFHVTGVAVRITRRGRWTLSWPARVQGKARRFLLRPISDSVRREVEAQVLGALPWWAGRTAPGPDASGVANGGSDPCPGGPRRSARPAGLPPAPAASPEGPAP